MVQQSDSTAWLIQVTALIFNTFNKVFLKDSSHLERGGVEEVHFISPKNVKNRRRIRKKQPIKKTKQTKKMAKQYESSKLRLKLKLLPWLNILALFCGIIN